MNHEVLTSSATGLGGNAIDVDEIYQRKYSLKPEDLILPIDVNTYRQSVREKNRVEMEVVAPRTTLATTTGFDIIDVDEIYHQKYSLKPDDLILPIDVATYRRSVRGKSTGKERQDGLEMVTQLATLAPPESATARMSYFCVFLVMD